jgi:hypothetical protein
VKSSSLAHSLSDILARSPSESLGPLSRYVVAADLRMGDGGKKDEFARSGKAAYAVLGGWYLEKGYTLVLDGDIEDLRNFWIKDILAAWPRMYALFDAFSDKGRLRKIVGERDLTLLRLRSYPYELCHGLRLDGERGSILLTHGHQASTPFAGKDYLSDYMQRWTYSSGHLKAAAFDPDGRERFKTERRLHRAASRLGIALIEGHTRRPLFESMTNRDSVRREVERLLREGDPRDGSRGDGDDAKGGTVDALIDLYRREAKARRYSSGPGLAGPAGIDEPSPCLFCPGRIGGAKGLRLLEIEGGSIRLVRWTKSGRLELRSAPIEGLLDRSAAEARRARDKARP